MPDRNRVYKYNGREYHSLAELKTNYEAYSSWLNGMVFGDFAGGEFVEDETSNKEQNQERVTHA